MGISSLDALGPRLRWLYVLLASCIYIPHRASELFATYVAQAFLAEIKKKGYSILNF